MKRDLLLILLLAAAMSVLCACGSDDRMAPGGSISGSPASSSEEAVSRDSTYCTLPSSSLEPEISTIDVIYFVEEDGSVRYYRPDDCIPRVLNLCLPEDLRGQNGEAISQEDLRHGDVLRLYFSEGYSYGEIGENGFAQLSTDADYAELLFRRQPDPMRIPTLQFTHIDGITARGGSLSPEEGSYAWDCTDENGEPVHLSREAEHPLLREDIPQIPMSGPFPLELCVETGALDWEVHRWDASQKGDESQPAGELVTTTPGAVTTEGIEPPVEDAPTSPVRAVVEDAAPGQIYRVTVRWEQGWAAYDFELYEG